MATSSRSPSFRRARKAGSFLSADARSWQRLHPHAGRPTKFTPDQAALTQWLYERGRKPSVNHRPVRDSAADDVRTL